MSDTNHTNHLFTVQWFINLAQNQANYTDNKIGLLFGPMSFVY